MTSSPVTVNLLDPEFYVDPWNAYRWLRDESPVHWDPVQKMWGISRYEDVVRVGKDTRRYSSFNGSRPHTDQTADQSMINLDNPEHQQQRRLVVRQFTPKAIRDHEAEVRALCERIVADAIASGGGSIEVVEAIASRLPAMEIGNLLGYAPEQWELIREVSEVTMLSAGQTRADGLPHVQNSISTDSAMRWAAATVEIIADRRDSPRDDLLSIWAHSETDGVVWDDRRILQECLLLVDGGAETTRTVIGAIMRELALRPDVQARLRSDPASLMLPAVEEFIRWVSPILNMRRTVTEAHELHGEELAVGDEVLLMYPSANRDERVFAAPDDFDIARTPNQHVAFGFGTHVCLGAPLARLELRVLFDVLVERLGPWRLVPGTEPQIIPATFTRAFDAVHIELAGAAR